MRNMEQTHQIYIICSIIILALLT